MILDVVSEFKRYAGLHPRFAEAFDFLARPDLGALSPGRHSVDGDLLYVSIDQSEGRTHEGARLEAHRRYIDVQFTIEGHEEIGWLPLSMCEKPTDSFDVARDIIFFEDRPSTWLVVPPGRFAIFFPQDAHAPLGGQGVLKKAIAKIAVAA